VIVKRDRTWMIALGSPARVYGGRLADRVGGGRVALAVFCSMIPATGILVSASTFGNHPEHASTATIVGYGALGGVGVNLALWQSYSHGRTATPAFWAFLLCYVDGSCRRGRSACAGRSKSPLSSLRGCTPAELAQI